MTLLDDPPPTTVARKTEADARTPVAETELMRLSARRRRRRLLAWSAVPALVVVAVATVLIGRALATDRGIAAVPSSTFDRGRATEAVTWFDRSEWINLYDREGPSFNRGVAWFASGDLARARAEFEAALDLAGGSARCRVLVNLALTVEAQGDALAEPDPHGSQALYAEAKGIAQGNPACLGRRTPEGDGEGDRLQRLLERLEDKLVTAESTEVSRPRADPDSTREPDDDFSELEQQLDENAETRSEGRELEEGVDLTPTRSRGPQW